MEADF